MQEATQAAPEIVTIAGKSLQLVEAPGPAKLPAPRVAAAPGSLVTLADGSEYRVAPAGNWLRLNRPLSKQARRRAARQR